MMYVCMPGMSQVYQKMHTTSISHRALCKAGSNYLCQLVYQETSGYAYPNVSTLMTPPVTLSHFPQLDLFLKIV